MVAFVGLTGVATVSVVRSNYTEEKTANNDSAVRIELESIKKIEDERKYIQRELMTMKEKKAFLEGSIVENEKEKNKLDETIRSSQDSIIRLNTEIDNLGQERDKLSEIVADLLVQVDDVKELELQITAQDEELEELNVLTLEVEKLQLENNKLVKTLSELNDSYELEIKKGKKALEVAEASLRLKEQEISTFSDKHIKENNKLLREVEALRREKNEIKNSNEGQVKSLIANETENKDNQTKKPNIKEIEELKALESNFQKLNGLRVIFSGNMIYDETKSQIVFRADNSIGIPIFQDDFTGSIAGKCGLPIDKKIENRCSATIIAEFVVENNGLFLRGKEIVEIVRK